MRASWLTTGAASARSRPLPCGNPSTMSTRTTSARPASAMRWAVVAPTFPAPITVTLLRAMRCDSLARCGRWDGWAAILRRLGTGRGDRGVDALGIAGEVRDEHLGQGLGG